MDAYIAKIGLTAAFLTTISFLPQAIQVIKTRDTESISLGMYVMFVSGVASWLAYGLFIKDMALILANSVTLVLSSIVLVFKLHEVFFKKK